jgi:hypothetical protein
VSPTLAVQCSNDGNSGWKVRCSVLELDETTNLLTSHYDDTSSVLLTEDFSMPHRIIMTAMDLNHAVVCYVSQNYYNGVCRLITLGSNGAAKLTAGPVFEYAGGYYQGRVNNDKVFGHSIAKLSRTTALVCFKDSVTVCRRLKILDEVAGTMDFTEVGSMNMCAGHYHIGIAVHDALSATLCFTAQFTGTSGIVECASVVETEATDHTCANEWSAYPEALPVCPVAASGTTGGSSSSPAPSSGSDGGGSSGDSPSPGANAGESPAPTPLHVDPRCDGAGTDPMASSPTFPIHQQAAWSSAAAFDQDYSLVCYRDISVNKAKCIATKRVREGEDQLRVGTIVPGVGGAIVANSNVMAFTGKFDHLLFFEILNT